MKTILNGLAILLGVASALVAFWSAVLTLWLGAFAAIAGAVAWMLPSHDAMGTPRRQLTETQRAQLLVLLRQSGSKGSVWLASEVGDGEALAFRGEIEVILRGADWPVVEVAATHLDDVHQPMGTVAVVRDPAAPHLRLWRSWRPSRRLELTCQS